MQVESQETSHEKLSDNTGNNSFGGDDVPWIWNYGERAGRVSEP